jgi:hypothetical protein
MKELQVLGAKYIGETVIDRACMTSNIGIEMCTDELEFFVVENRT